MTISDVVLNYELTMIGISVTMTGIGVLMLVTLAASYLLRNHGKYTKLLPLIFSLMPAYYLAQIGGYIVTTEMDYLIQIAHLKETGVAISSTLEQSLVTYGITADTVALTGVLTNPITLGVSILFVLIIAMILYRKA